MSTTLVTGFEPSPGLPVELRCEVWRLASAVPSPRPGVCILPQHPRGSACPRTVVDPGNGVMLLTCWEARRIALESLVTRPYDPTADILSIPCSRAMLFFDNFCGNGAPAWLYEVGHVATPFEPAMVCKCITWALGVGMRSLESLSIVSPARLNS